MTEFIKPTLIIVGILGIPAAMVWLHLYFNEVSMFKAIWDLASRFIVWASEKLAPPSQLSENPALAELEATPPEEPLAPSAPGLRPEGRPLSWSRWTDEVFGLPRPNRKKRRAARCKKCEE